MKKEDTYTNDGNDDFNFMTEIFMGVLVLCLYTLGIYLHSKIITTSKRDKEMTWKLDVVNSTVLSFHYGHVLIMKGVTYLVKDLHVYTGSWFCYLSKVITISGNALVTGHSLIIALMKYTMIVHHIKVRRYGQDKVKKIFLCINIIYPIYIQCFFHIVRPDFLFVYDSISQANRCLGKSDLMASDDSNKTATKLHGICKLDVPSDPISAEFFLYLFRTGICWFHIVIVYFNVFNITEAFVYCAIFSFMRREISPSSNKVVAESIGESATKLNLRKVLVNAQIKAMISLIEAFMSFAFVIIVYFTVRGTYGSMSIMVFLYMVILPYAFLMNTSHNKNRIVEHGWKNVLNNILGRAQNLSNDPETTPPAQATESGSKRGKEKGKKQDDISRYGKLSEKNKTKALDDSEKDSNTPCIRQTQQGKQKIRFLLRGSWNTEIKIFTTKESGNSFNERDRLSEINSSRPNSSVVTKFNEPEEPERLIVKMIENINDEDIYKEYFKKLVFHFYSSGYGQIHPELCLQDDSLPNVVPETSNPIVSSGSPLVQSIIETNEMDLENIDGKSYFVEGKIDEVDVRRRILRQIKLQCLTKTK